MTTNDKTNHLTAPNRASFACFWLDHDVDSTEDNRETQHDLRQMINHLRTFDNSDECEQNIRQINNEKIILIVSGSLGRELVPRLHDLSQLSACYIFCRDKYTNKQWAHNYPKVSGVFVERAKLLTAISEDQIVRIRTENEALTSGMNDHAPSRNNIFHVIPVVGESSSIKASQIK